MKHFPLLAFLVICWACQPVSHRRFDPRVVDFQVEYSPIYAGNLYPSLILGLSHSNIASGDTQSLFTVSLVSPAKDAVVRIVVDSSAFSYVTILQEVLPVKGETYTLRPQIKWKYDKLYGTRQPVSVDLTFTCYVNDEEVDVKNIRLNCRSVNECLLGAVYKGRSYDFKWLFAGYVNEDHPYIDQILADILDEGVVNRFSGYQGGSVTVEDQVYAVWHYVLERGVSYSSITCTSNPSRSVRVQHIRFFDEVYNTRQANCIDACVFLASILRKIGLKPVIFVEPCHAYLGYYTDRQRRNIALLETTMTAWVQFPMLQRALDADGRLPAGQLDKLRPYLTVAQQKQYEDGDMSFEDLKRCVSRAIFVKASTYNRDSYQANKSAFADPTDTSYQQLDIEQLRQYVQPVK
ncbi:MAG: hypothetical protein AUK63_338 [bacterium P3]|nr:MAG: hypothetical protein AUK63_338 [bacterium P3]KWW42702.1 MAG: hypothetical protein F083_106 [bacterium F083]